MTEEERKELIKDKKRWAKEVLNSEESKRKRRETWSKINRRQLSVVMEYLSNGFRKTEAYLKYYKAGKTSNTSMTRASLFFKKEKVKKKIEELLGKRYSLETIKERVDRLAQSKNEAVQLRALELLAKLCRYLDTNVNVYSPKPIVVSPQVKEIKEAEEVKEAKVIALGKAEGNGNGV